MRSILLGVCITWFFLLAPYAYVLMAWGTYSVPIELVDDSHYYLARMVAVSHGYPLIGNPYIAEHANDPAIAFFGADWLGAIPLFLGFSVVGAELWNIVFWSAASALSLWYFARSFAWSSRQYLFLVSVVTVSALPMLLRPVAMQIVFPLFLAFLAALKGWLDEPHSHRRSVLLALFSIIPFYLYTYFWQIVVVAFAILHLIAWKKAQYRMPLFWVDCAVGIGALPMALYTLHQLSLPLYWETVTRIGFVATHTFGFSGVLAALFIVVPLFALWFSYRSSLDSFWVIVAISLWVAAWSNVISGKDLETAVHMMRFVMVYAVSASVAVLFSLENKKTISIYAALICVVVVGVYQLHDVYRFSAVLSSDPRTGEQYAPLFTWLNEHAQTGDVVLSPYDIGRYMPIMTTQFVLYHPNAELFLMSDREVEDRYLASHVFDSLTLSDIERDFRLYAGAGNSLHQYKTHNREVTLCRWLQQSDCGVYATEFSWRGEAYFRSLLNRFQDIQRSPSKTLRTWNVRYVILDSIKLPKSNLPLQVQVVIGPYTIYRVPVTTS
ncbi:hypothetical protein EBR66_00655 [bacterium]|nr:hypothetical protein [bacterium]